MLRTAPEALFPQKLREWVCICALLMVLCFALGRLSVLRRVDLSFLDEAGLCAAAVCLFAYLLFRSRPKKTSLHPFKAQIAASRNGPDARDESVADGRPSGASMRWRGKLNAMVSRPRRTRDIVSEWLDSLPDATIITSPGGVVLMANRRAAEMARTASPSALPDIAGRHVADVLRELTSSHRASAFVDRALQNLLDNQDDKIEADAALNQGIEIVDTAGRSLFIKCAATRPAHRRSANLVFHIADVTQLRAVERQRDITLRFLSHDMRSPQAAIVALVEHRRQFPSDMPEQKFVELIGQYASSSLSLADDFLFLAHAESRPPEFVPVDVALLLGDAIDDTWFQARDKATEVRLAAEPGMIVSADARLLRRAFANLIGNAIKYGPEGATVEIVVDDVETHWKIAVIDYGIGISPEHVPHLFGEFVRLGDDRTRPGHGLGLAFVKSVVDTLGGHIDVHCRKDGTTFAVLLPKAKEAVANADPQHPY